MAGVAGIPWKTNTEHIWMWKKHNGRTFSSFNYRLKVCSGNAFFSSAFPVGRIFNHSSNSRWLHTVTKMENIEELVSIPSEDALQSPIISKKRKRPLSSPIIRSSRQSIKQKRLERSPPIDEIFSQSSCEAAQSSVPSSYSTFQPKSLFISQETISSQKTTTLEIEENHSDEDESDTAECLDITVRRILVEYLSTDE